MCSFSDSSLQVLFVFPLFKNSKYVTVCESVSYVALMFYAVLEINKLNLDIENLQRTLAGKPDNKGGMCAVHKQALPSV